MDPLSRRGLAGLLVLALLLAGLPVGLRTAASAPRVQVVPVTSHPRL